MATRKDNFTEDQNQDLSKGKGLTSDRVDDNDDMDQQVSNDLEEDDEDIEDIDVDEDDDFEDDTDEDEEDDTTE
jgi:ribonuclease E